MTDQKFCLKMHRIHMMTGIVEMALSVNTGADESLEYSSIGFTNRCSGQLQFTWISVHM